jgi:hypothetical protein
MAALTRSFILFMLSVIRASSFVNSHHLPVFTPSITAEPNAADFPQSRFDTRVWRFAAGESGGKAARASKARRQTREL